MRACTSAVQAIREHRRFLGLPSLRAAGLRTPRLCDLLIIEPLSRPIHTLRSIIVYQSPGTAAFLLRLAAVAPLTQGDGVA
jgi:hypothetical protein